jgi:hypothetical protein
VYDVLVRFFPCRVYTDSNLRNILGYKWPLARCCHLVGCLVVLMDGLEDGYGYVHHDDYYITLLMLLITMLMLVYACYSS